MDEKTTETEDAKEGGPGASRKKPAVRPPREVGGRAGPEPTRYGDWEVNGICVDF